MAADEAAAAACACACGCAEVAEDAAGGATSAAAAPGCVIAGGGDTPATSARFMSAVGGIVATAAAAAGMVTGRAGGQGGWTGSSGAGAIEFAIAALIIACCALNCCIACCCAPSAHVWIAAGQDASARRCSRRARRRSDSLRVRCCPSPLSATLPWCVARVEADSVREGGSKWDSSSRAKPRRQRADETESNRSASHLHSANTAAATATTLIGRDTQSSRSGAHSGGQRRAEQSPITPSRPQPPFASRSRTLRI